MASSSGIHSVVGTYVVDALCLTTTWTRWWVGVRLSLVGRDQDVPGLRRGGCWEAAEQDVRCKPQPLYIRHVSPSGPSSCVIVCPAVCRPWGLGSGSKIQCMGAQDHALRFCPALYVRVAKIAGTP
jgi:hypothetical protein